ncbi:MAG: hypothetical protein K9W44_03460 [Candidatus Lokiarchaeota archaeon]|nr:hypothetical protein [Candidatus Harpocratesius repetitus]
MADRVTDFIISEHGEINSHSFIEPIVKTPDVNRVVNFLQNDIPAQKNILFYAPPQHSRYEIIFQATLPMILQYHKHLVFVLSDLSKKKQILQSLRTMDESLFSSVLICDLCGYHSQLQSILGKKFQKKINEEQIITSSQMLQIKSKISTLFDSFSENCAVHQFDFQQIIQFYITEANNLPISQILKYFISEMSIIFITYDDLFSFHPLQPGFFKNIGSIENSILILDDCHQIHNYLLNNYSIHLQTSKIELLYNYLIDLKSNAPTVTQYRFFAKFLSLFLKYIKSFQSYPNSYSLKQPKVKSMPITEEFQFRPIDFLFNLCEKHKCSFDRLASILHNHFKFLLTDSTFIKDSSIFSTFLALFNYFFVVIQQRTTPTLPYAFTIEISNERTVSTSTSLLTPSSSTSSLSSTSSSSLKSISPLTSTLHMNLMDIRLYSDPLFQNAFSSISISPSLDVRSYLAITGLGSLSKGFQIRSLPVEISQDRIKVWGDTSITPFLARYSSVISAKYTAKLVYHAQLINRPTIVFFSNPHQFKEILSNKLIPRLEKLHYSVKRWESHQNNTFPYILKWLENLNKMRKESNKTYSDAKKYILLVDLSQISLTELLHILPYFDVFSFISFPFESSTLRLLRRKKYLTRKYDARMAQIYSLSQAFFKIHAICSFAPFNNSQHAILLFYDGQILEYQKHLLPWVYQFITFIPASAQELSTEIKLHFQTNEP